MKEKDKIHGAHWLLSFRQIRIEVASIINGIYSTRSPSLDDFTAFQKAFEVFGLLTDDAFRA